MPLKRKYYPVALTIAGSDSGGGAGIQADLRTFSAYGVYGCSVITAVTAQNPRKILMSEPLHPSLVSAQMKAVLCSADSSGAGKFAVRAVKTGMLFNSEIIAAVVSFLKKASLPLVVDPVITSSGGTTLLQHEAVNTLKEKLFPLAGWITPNVHEAELLLGRKINTFDDMLECARVCAGKWDCGCVLKGGHLVSENGTVSDAVAFKTGVYRLSSPMIDNGAGHGTGCTFSAALTSGFALGFSWKKALLSAKAFVYGSLLEAIKPGAGIEAMYPPCQNYLRKVELEKC